MRTLTGRLADVGDVGWYGLPTCKVLALLKDYVSVIRFSNTMQCENQAEAIESCGEKCASLCRVYKLIMISRVPGYGHLEYLVPGYHVNHIKLLLINIVGFVNEYF